MVVLVVVTAAVWGIVAIADVGGVVAIADVGGAVAIADEGGVVDIADEGGVVAIADVLGVAIADVWAVSTPYELVVVTVALVEAIAEVVVVISLITKNTSSIQESLARCLVKDKQGGKGIISKS